MMDCFFITCLVIYYSTWSFQHACQCFQSNFDVPRTPNLFKLPQTPNERTILPKLTMTRYGRNLNLKKIQLENSTGKANVIPKREPEQIFSSEEQLELPKLKKDIKQYFKSSTLFGEVVKGEWGNFLAHDSSHFKMNNIDWPLADIVKKKEQQKKKEEEERHSTVNLSAQLFLDMPRPEGLSEVAETRVAAQRDPLPLSM